MLLAYFAAFCFAAKAFTDKVSFWDMTSIMPLVTAISSLPISLNGSACARRSSRNYWRSSAGFRADGTFDLNRRDDRVSTVGIGRRVLLSGTHHQALSRVKRNRGK